MFIPWGTNIPHTRLGGGDKHFFGLGGTNIFYTQWETNVFYQREEWNKHSFMIMIMIVNVSEVNILPSEARRPSAVARISGPVGP